MWAREALKGAQDGVRGEFLRWFPPNSPKGLWSPDGERFRIQPGISFYIVFIDQKPLWAIFFSIWAGRVLKMG